MIKVYGIKNCNKIRDTLKWLDAEGADYEFVDIKKDPMTPEQLADIVEKVGLDVVLNRKGMKWRQLGLAKKELSERELFDKLHTHQTMIKRPLMVRDEAVLVGYDEDAFESFVG
ncbi:MAG: arsenate reductase family protein [Balneolaceae bacterium]